MRIRTALILLLLYSLNSSLSYADDKRGRLPDGRAYRTDAAGNQLIDYIAELEVEIDSLKRQVMGLEDENKEKLDIINRLRAACPDSSDSRQIVEKNLVVKEIPATKSPVVPENTRAIEVVKKEATVVPTPFPIATSTPMPIRAEPTATPLVKAKAISENEEQEIDEKLKSPVASFPISPARANAAAALRSRLIADTNSLRSLLVNRDQNLKMAEGNPSFDGSKMKDTDELNMKIENIRAEANRLEKVEELSGLRNQISEVRGKLQNDLGLLRRYVKR